MLDNNLIKYFFPIVFATLLFSCSAGKDKQGLEYAPQMYHSVAYEPLTQITDKSSGDWLDSNEEDKQGEFYNSNPYNPHGMTMRVPPKNTVRRGVMLPYRLTIEQTDLADSLKSPYATNNGMVLKEGRQLYNSFCKHCHGNKGGGNGKVAMKYIGVASLNSDAIKSMTEGRLFHVITHGKGLMAAHDKQISIEDRWKITRYVKELQKKN